MVCPICDQKPMNCDCTPRERAMWQELQELDDRPSLIITDAEREAIATAAAVCEGFDELPATLRGLLERLGGGE